METLEEAALRLYPRLINDSYNPMEDDNEEDRNIWIKGAKWQAKQMHTEQDMKHAYTQGARLALISQSPLALHRGEFPTPEKWFNEFKKK